VKAATLPWKPRTGEGGATMNLANDAERYWAHIPTQPDGSVVNYSVRLEFTDGATVVYPQNPGDPFYEFYVGNVTPLWCADFEAGMGDWSVLGTPTNRVEWEAGPPMGLGGDPTAAHGGANVLGIDLGTAGNMDGLYRSRTTQWAVSPEIDLAGNTSVRLQYYRWLNAEDGAYDPATILANEVEVWRNHSTDAAQDPGLFHTDKEWRFHDVDVSSQTGTGKLQLKFQLTSDQGQSLGGWTMDDVCLVIAGPPSGTCGNYNVDPDKEEECDDGNTEDGDGCSSSCGIEGDDGGCCSAGTNPAGPLALSAMFVGLVVVRRRRRR
jgi:cysteine-rich repeat protein